MVVISVSYMIQNPASHASDALTTLSRRLHDARLDERRCADRLESVDADLALQRARLSADTPAENRQRTLIFQRVADLLELRTKLMAERVRLRTEIDDLDQRKEAVSAALAVLRAKATA